MNSQNLIELKNYTRRETNVDWPERLAKLVAAKGDGTRLVHLVPLNTGNEEYCKYSKILEEHTEACEKIRDALPDAIIVKVKNASFSDKIYRFLVC
jgi:hypothetical protein